jgi:hypothetical protein
MEITLHRAIAARFFKPHRLCENNHKEQQEKKKSVMFVLFVLELREEPVGTVSSPQRSEGREKKWSIDEGSC